MNIREQRGNILKTSKGGMSMKKLLAAIFLLIFAISAYAKEITYFTLTGKIYNSIFKQLDKRTVKLDYDTDYDSVILYYSGYIYDIAIEINKENRTNLMRQNLNSIIGEIKTGN